MLDANETITGPKAVRDRSVQKGDLIINVKDYGALGNGTADDTAAINNALAALVPGSILFFPSGRYMTNGGHVITQPSIMIKGPSGRAQTYNSQAQIYLRNNANADMLTIAANQVTVRDLSLYGNKGNQTAPSRGLVTPPTSGANYLLLDAVWVDSFNGDGFSFESSGGTLSSTITNCESRVNNGYGMRLYGTATDSMVSNCYIDQNVQSGIFCSAGDLSLTGCHIWGNGTGVTGDVDGITFQSSSGCRVINCYIETQINGAGIRFKTGANKGHVVSSCDIWSNGTQGIYAFSASNCVFSSNVIRTNNYKAQSASTGAGIAVDSCTAMLITGNQFFSVGANRQTYGYYEIGASNTDIRFMDNMSRATDHTTGGMFFGPGTRDETMFPVAIQTGRATPTYGASITPNANSGNWQTITVTNTAAFTVNVPTNPPDSSHTQELTVEIVNSSGGAMGAITWNAVFVLVGGAFTNPANTKKRWIRFAWNGSNWVEISRAGADY